MCQFIHKYPVINSGISVHFWKDISILTDESGVLSKYNGVKYEMNKQYTDILALCNGLNSVNSICNEILRTHDGINDQFDQNSVTQMIEKMCAAKIIHMTDSPNEEELFWGERGLSYPIYISIELTNKCNFACDFCYKSAQFAGNCISPTTMYNIYSLLGKKTKHIQFTGGEPFLNNRIDEYINLFEDNYISIITNGSLLFLHDDSILRKVSLYQISLYGCDANDYAKNTGNNIGWSNLRMSIDKLNKLNSNYHLSVVLNKNNYLKIEEYVCAAIELGAKKIEFGTQSPVGRGMNVDTCLTIDEFRISYRMLKLVKHKFSKYIDVEEWSHMGYHDSNSNEPYSHKSYQGLLECGGGTSQFVISQSGRVRPCELLPESYFDLGGIEIIQKAIHGHYLGERIAHSAKEFGDELNKHKKDYSMFCGPLEKILLRNDK